LGERQRGSNETGYTGVLERLTGILVGDPLPCPVRLATYPGNMTGGESEQLSHQTLTSRRGFPFDATIDEF
jgi:hypothetical protein